MSKLPSKKDFRDGVGNWSIKSLFYETSNTPHLPYYFTTGYEDIEVEGRKLISLRKRFLDSNDITGYTIATEYLGGYQHWKEIKNSVSLGGRIKEWEEELEMKLRAMGIKQAIDSASKGNFSASKFLVDRGWVVGNKKLTKKEERELKKKQDNEIKDIFAEDLRRLESVSQAIN